MCKTPLKSVFLLSFCPIMLRNVSSDIPSCSVKHPGVIKSGLFTDLK